MDDFALLDSDREALKQMRHDLRHWLEERLKLRVKERVTQIYSVAHGWPFLGFRVMRGRLELRRPTWRRLKKRLGGVYHEYRRGRITLEDLVRSVECRIAHLERGATRGLRRKEVKSAEL